MIKKPWIILMLILFCSINLSAQESENSSDEMTSQEETNDESTNAAINPQNKPAEELSREAEKSDKLAFYELERKILGVDENEYRNLSKLSLDNKLKYLDNQKDSFGATLALALIPVTYPLGIHFYINGDWIRGLCSNLSIGISTSAFLIVLSRNVIEGIALGAFGKEADTKGLDTVLAITMGLYFGWYIYGIIYASVEVPLYNGDIEERKTQLIDLHNNSSSSMKDDNYFKNNFAFGIFPLQDGVGFAAGLRL